MKKELLRINELIKQYKMYGSIDPNVLTELENERAKIVAAIGRKRMAMRIRSKTH